MLCGGAKADEQYPITYRVTSSTLNVRLGPGTEHEAFYQLTRGEEVQGEEVSGDWVAINCYGFRGFVYADYLQDKSQPTSGCYGTYLGRYYGTGYDGCRRCSPNGITASGTRPVAGRTVAMSGLPFGARVYIVGIGYRIVEDRGVGPGCIDIFCNNHSECYALTGYYDVYLCD